MQPITIKGHSIITIDSYKQFFTPPIIIRKSYDNLLKNCKYFGKYLLNDEDKKQLRYLYHGFVFNELVRFARFPSSQLDGFGSADIIFMKKTEYNKIPYVTMNIFIFVILNNDYKKWLNAPYRILCSTKLKDIPEPISQCERLFDKNVLLIKKLVKDIGDLNYLTIKETKNCFLYDNSSLITNTFFTEPNKKIQCYGYILLLYDNSDEPLVNSKNRPKFNILVNIEK